MAKEKMRRATIAEIKEEIIYRREYHKMGGRDRTRSQESRLMSSSLSEAYRVALGLLEGNMSVFWSQDNKLIGGKIGGEGKEE